MSNSYAIGGGTRRGAAPAIGEPVIQVLVALQFPRSGPGSPGGSAEVFDIAFAGWEGAPTSKL